MEKNAQTQSRQGKTPEDERGVEGGGKGENMSAWPVGHGEQVEVVISGGGLRPARKTREIYQ